MIISLNEQVLYPFIPEKYNAKHIETYFGIETWQVGERYGNQFVLNFPKRINNKLPIIYPMDVFYEHHKSIEETFKFPYLNIRTRPMLLHPKDELIVTNQQTILCTDYWIWAVRKNYLTKKEDLILKDGEPDNYPADASYVHYPTADMMLLSYFSRIEKLMKNQL